MRQQARSQHIMAPGQYRSSMDNRAMNRLLLFRRLRDGWPGFVPRPWQRFETLKRHNGFLFTEVMIAVALIAGCLIAILQSYRSSIKAITAGHDRYHASLILESRLIELENNIQFPAPIDPDFSTTTEAQDISTSDEHRHHTIVKLAWGGNAKRSTIESFIITIK